MFLKIKGGKVFVDVGLVRAICSMIFGVFLCGLLVLLLF